MMTELEVNLSKEVKDLYNENYKTLTKKIEENTSKWKDILCSVFRRIYIIKNIHTSQSQLQIQCNPYQDPKGISHINRTDDPKICMEPQKILNRQ